MPSWLILSWALTLGVVPQQIDVVTQGGGEYYDEIRTDILSTVAELSFEARFFGHAKIWGGIENYQYFSGFGVSGLGFYPYRADYVAGAAIFAGPIELGVKHECDHPVVSGALKGNYLSMETQVYVKISGSIK